MKTHRLPGLLFEQLIEVDAVLVELADAVAHVEERQQPGGVPGGACGKLGLLDQHHVGPAQFGQMVEHVAAHDAAADHHHPRLIAQAKAFPVLHARLVVSKVLDSEPEFAPWSASNRAGTTGALLAKPEERCLR